VKICDKRGRKKLSTDTKRFTKKWIENENNTPNDGFKEIEHILLITRSHKVTQRMAT
jgi:hypothetical protein